MKIKFSHVKHHNVLKGLRALGANAEVIAKQEATLRGRDDGELLLRGISDYGWLIQEGLREVTFSAAEVRVLAAITRGTEQTTPDQTQYLDDAVQELLANTDTCLDFGLAESEAELLVTRLRDLNALQRLALWRVMQTASDSVNDSEHLVETCQKLGLRVH